MISVEKQGMGAFFIGKSKCIKEEFLFLLHDRSTCANGEKQDSTSTQIHDALSLIMSGAIKLSSLNSLFIIRLISAGLLIKYRIVIIILQNAPKPIFELSFFSSPLE